MRDRHRHLPPTAPVTSLRRFLTADAVAASNYIEGFRVDTGDVRDDVLEVARTPFTLTMPYPQDRPQAPGPGCRNCSACRFEQAALR